MINNLTLVGRLTREPELRYTKSSGDNKDKAYNNITNIDAYFNDDFVEIEDDNIPF